MGLLNWLFGLAAKKVADKEYGPAQTAYAPDKAPQQNQAPVKSPDAPQK